MPDTNRLPASPIPSTLLEDAQTITGALATIGERFSSFPCLAVVARASEARFTIGDLWTRARRAHAGVVAHGLRPGDIAIVVLPTGIDLAGAYFGIMLAGGIPALVATPSNRFSDHRIYAERLAMLVEHAHARFIVAEEDVAKMLHARGGVPGAMILTPSTARPESAVAPRAAHPDDVATLQFSSGSTGVPKGVLVTHGAILNNFRAIRSRFGITTEDVSVSWAPLYHDMGLFDGFLLPLLSGCGTVLIDTMDFIRHPSLWLRTIHHHRGTLSWAPNFAYALCAKRIADRDLQGLDLSSWRLAASGAERVLAPTVEEFAARFSPYGYRPNAMTPIYGMAENVTIATAHAIGEEPRVETLDRHRLASADVAEPVAANGAPYVSVGTPLPGCAVEIRDGGGRALPERRVGTIWLRSDSLCSGYHRDPAATATTFVDGWLDTGDRGYLADEHLYFVSREKDVIVIGGEKYAPEDIEAVINAVTGVREGCVIVFGVLNSERGTEDLGAVVETKLEGDDACDALRETIRREVAGRTGLALRYAILVPPGGIEKTSSGKLARRATQKRYEDLLG